jgi:cytochrome c biogenesis protein CcmG, thiol:disulfide interchange protein DsbE
MQISRIIPIAFFLILVAILAKGLGLDNRLLRANIVGKPVPEFSLPSLEQGQPPFSSKDFKNKITLLNVWGSWCPSCRREHPYLMAISNNPRFELVGLDWKDNPENAKTYLAQNGNPFLRNGVDSNGRVGLDLGVSGAPESFLIDPNGIVRLQVRGMLDAEVWASQVEPVLTKIESE